MDTYYAAITCQKPRRSKQEDYSYSIEAIIRVLTDLKVMDSEYDPEPNFQKDL